MIKFSVIVPVYNTYDFLDKCLDSIVDQTVSREKYEIIIVNDGTPDNSEEIILKYKEKYPKTIKYIKKENGGLSSARNEGIKHVEGEYIVLVDSDDYLDKHLFEMLEAHIEGNHKPDVVRINSRDVKIDGTTIQEVIIKKSRDEIELLKNVMQANALEVPWAYVYKTSFFKKENFKYEHKIHEDYGLTPIILYKAEKISYLNYIGYNYVEREGSIMAETKYEKMKQRVDDMFYLYKIHMETIKKDTKKGKLLRGYSLEAMLSKLTFLNKEDLDIKLKEVKDYIDASDIYCYNFKKMLKKTVLVLNIKLYLNLYRKYKF